MLLDLRYLVVDAQHDVALAEGEGLNFAILAMLAVLVRQGHEMILVKVQLFEVIVETQIDTADRFFLVGYIGHALCPV